VGERDERVLSHSTNVLKLNHKITHLEGIKRERETKINKIRLHKKIKGDAITGM